MLHRLRTGDTLRKARAAGLWRPQSLRKALQLRLDAVTIGTSNISSVTLSTNTMSSLNSNLVSLSTTTLSTNTLSAVSITLSNVTFDTASVSTSTTAPSGNTKAYLVITIEGVIYKVPMY